MKTIKTKELNQIQNYKEFSKKDLVEISKEPKIIYVNKIPTFFFYEEKIIQTLMFLQSSEQMILKKITIDMGAIKYIVNGADIMRPGIVEIEKNIEKNEPVVVVDINHKKPIAIGIALLYSEEMEKNNSGKVVKNIHYVGDEIWGLYNYK
ncbi:MAG: DUF1947 domain-containing protein [Candidatus Woesearchaeota archaeon]